MELKAPEISIIHLISKSHAQNQHQQSHALMQKSENCYTEPSVRHLVLYVLWAKDDIYSSNDLKKMKIRILLDIENYMKCKFQLPIKKML